MDKEKRHTKKEMDSRRGTGENEIVGVTKRYIEENSERGQSPLGAVGPRSEI